MTNKHFEKIRIAVVVILVAVIGVSLITEISFLIPLAIIISFFLINHLFHRVKEVVADERDYKISGQSARATINIAGISLATLGTTLIVQGVEGERLYEIGHLLLYVVCFLLVTNIFTFLFFQKKSDK